MYLFLYKLDLNIKYTTGPLVNWQSYSNERTVSVESLNYLILSLHIIGQLSRNVVTICVI